MRDPSEVIAEMRALLAKATPGPWDCGSGSKYEPATNVYCNDELGSIVATCAHAHNFLVSREAEAANAALIVAAINALPALLAIAEAAEDLRAAGLALERRLIPLLSGKLKDIDHAEFFAFFAALSTVAPVMEG